MSNPIFRAEFSKKLRSLTGGFSALLISLLLTNCQLAPFPEKKQCTIEANIYHEGLITCFEKDIKNSKGKDLFCETSGSVHFNNQFVLANDKSMPDGIHSSIFSLPSNNGKPIDNKPEYEKNSTFLAASKFEDLTLTPDKKYIIATTAFDREWTEKHTDWDKFHTLLMWPSDDPELVKIVSPTTRNNVISSWSLKEKISQALATPNIPLPYFKIEGLATIPGNKLLFGIRAIGKNYTEAVKVMKIVEVGYKISNGELLLDEDFKLIYEFQPASKLGLKLPLGISSLEYDEDTDRLYLLTSYEEERENEKKNIFAGYLWISTISDLYAQRKPVLVMDARGKPLKFSHKPEGVTGIDRKRVFVIHDDDKVRMKDQKPNQAAYSLLEFTDCDEGPN